MLMMLALRFAEFALLCVQTPGDGSASLQTEFQLMLMMLALRFAEFV